MTQTYNQAYAAWVVQGKLVHKLMLRLRKVKSIHAERRAWLQFHKAYNRKEVMGEEMHFLLFNRHGRVYPWVIDRKVEKHTSRINHDLTYLSHTKSFYSLRPKDGETPSRKGKHHDVRDYSVRNERIEFTRSVRWLTRRGYRPVQSVVDGHNHIEWKRGVRQCQSLRY